MGYTGYRTSPSMHRPKLELIHSEFMGEQILDLEITEYEAYVVTAAKGDRPIMAWVVLFEYSQDTTWVKVIDEYMGPYYYKCPKRLLDLLPPTESKDSLAWRKKCLESQS